MGGGQALDSSSTLLAGGECAGNQPAPVQTKKPRKEKGEEEEGKKEQSSENKPPARLNSPEARPGHVGVQSGNKGRRGELGKRWEAEEWAHDSTCRDGESDCVYVCVCMSALFSCDCVCLSVKDAFRCADTRFITSMSTSDCRVTAMFICLIFEIIFFKITKRFSCQDRIPPMLIGCLNPLPHSASVKAAQHQRVRQEAMRGQGLLLRYQSSHEA